LKGQPKLDKELEQCEVSSSKTSDEVMGKKELGQGQIEKSDDLLDSHIVRFCVKFVKFAQFKYSCM
jgi:hypothetical protein